MYRNKTGEISLLLHENVTEIDLLIRGCYFTYTHYKLPSLIEKIHNEHAIQK